MSLDRYRTMQQIQQQYCVHPSYTTLPGTTSACHPPVSPPVITNRIPSSNTSNITATSPHSPAESDSTSGCSSAGGSTGSDRDGSPQHHVTFPPGMRDGGDVGDVVVLDPCYAGSVETSFPADCPSEPMAARAELRVVKNNNLRAAAEGQQQQLYLPSSTAPSPIKSNGNTALEGPGSMSRGEGYCCTVQPIAAGQCETSPPAECSCVPVTLSPSPAPVMPTSRHSDDSHTSNRFLSFPGQHQLPPPSPTTATGMVWSNGGPGVVADETGTLLPAAVVSPGSGKTSPCRRPPPPVPPPRHASLRRDQVQ